MSKATIKNSEKTSFLTKTGKIGLLLAIKESYLFVKNTLGLGVHPLKTLNSLAREKDRSQQLLVIGLPFWLFLGGLMVVYVGRRLLATSQEWGIWAKSSFLLVMTISTLTALYLSYWIIKIKKQDHEQG